MKFTQAFRPIALQTARPGSAFALLLMAGSISGTLTACESREAAPIAQAQAPTRDWSQPIDPREELVALDALLLAMKENSFQSGSPIQVFVFKLLTIERRRVEKQALEAVAKEHALARADSRASFARLYDEQLNVHGNPSNYDNGREWAELTTANAWSSPLSKIHNYLYKYNEAKLLGRALPDRSELNLEAATLELQSYEQCLEFILSQKIPNVANLEGVRSIVNIVASGNRDLKTLRSLRDGGTAAPANAQ